jgi:hypothetical protein
MNLTVEQQQAIDQGEPVPLTVDGRECVLIRKDVYEHVKTLYDDSEWTDEELSLNAATTFEDADSAGPIP